MDTCIYFSFLLSVVALLAPDGYIYVLTCQQCLSLFDVQNSSIYFGRGYW